MRLTEIEWQGDSSLVEIAAGLEENGKVEVLLPSNFNHALFAHFYPDAPAGIEALDINGGAEVLQRAAELDGLEDLRALQRWVAERQARVQLLSPPRIVIRRAQTDEP